MSQATPLPRLLLVEDDSVSRAFLTDALDALPAQVDAVESIAAALKLAERETYALWVIDAHLPDGDGARCLAILNEHRPGVPGLAITAEAFFDEIERLRHAGFVDVLQKPISIATLQAAVGGALACDKTSSAAFGLSSSEGEENLRLWNDPAALAAAGGRHEIVAALRNLFLQELPLLRGQVAKAADQSDDEGIRAILHKLKASCGFVGAARLLAVVQALSAAPLDGETLRRFHAAVDQQLEDSSFQS